MGTPWRAQGVRTSIVHRYGTVERSVEPCQVRSCPNRVPTETCFGTTGRQGARRIARLSRIDARLMYAPPGHATASPRAFWGPVGTQRTPADRRGHRRTPFNRSLPGLGPTGPWMARRDAVGSRMGPYINRALIRDSRAIRRAPSGPVVPNQGSDGNPSEPDNYGPTSDNYGPTGPDGFHPTEVDLLHRVIQLAQGRRGLLHIGGGIQENSTV